MEFRSLVKYSIKMRQCGYYAIRQQMIKNGASLYDVAKVLSFQLRILGAMEK